MFGSVQPEMKEALRALHDLHERGIIDAEFAVRPADKVPDEIASERVGMINGPFWISLWPLMDSINVNPEADWLPLIPGTVDGTEFRPFGNSAITGRYAVRNDRSNWAWYRIFGPGAPGEITHAGLYHYWDNDRFVIDKFAGAPPEAMVEKWGSLSSLQNEVIIKIIVGDYEVDYFDEFVDDWHKLGGTEITAAVNEWYSSASN